ncbi:MAG TPA: hypothetical protein V6C91_03120 [Coleofasciculaceae cyanobacterium]
MLATLNYYTCVKPFKIGFGFWFQWVLVTFLGFLVSLYWIEVGEKPDIRIIEAAIGGVAIGLAQWFVLRQKFFYAEWWIVASFVSWSFLESSGIGAIGWVAPRTLSIPIRIIFGVVTGAQVGALMGVAQWLVLWKQVENAWRWILASTVSWALALALGWMVGGVLRLVTGIFLAEVVGLALVWILVGVMTGVTLCRVAGDSAEKA